MAAHGLDIPYVAYAVNFDLPNDIDDNVHKIGRTRRAGKSRLEMVAQDEFFESDEEQWAADLSATCSRSPSICLQD